MKIIGIICEYNPFHKGHRKQIEIIRAAFGEDCGIVCLMSGNFVQRGQPAIFDKSLRAEAALRCGADLVLELPVQYALSSAEGFAAGGVSVLDGFCDVISFGAETGTADTLMATACGLLRPDFSETLHRELDKGLSFPAARQAALDAMGLASSLLANPNDILAVEYCKALLSRGSAMTPMVITREGNYHAESADPENPSATSLRSLALGGNEWLQYVPEAAGSVFDGAALHSLAFGERAVLARLRTMADADFEALPYGSEGLWRKLMHESRRCATLEEILTAVKSKRYTRSRLDRMVMCAFLELTAEDLARPAPYSRVLGFSENGRTVLKQARKSGLFPHTGEKTGSPYEVSERRCDDLYGLFCREVPSPAGYTDSRRVYIHEKG